MKHRTKKDILGIRGNLPAIIAFMILGVILVAIMIYCFSMIVTTEYAEPDTLVYEECTFVEAKRARSGKSGTRYDIYVEEYEEPLKIYSVTLRAIERSDLLSIEKGELIKVSLKESGKKYHAIVAMYCGDKCILDYKDYLREHEENDTLGCIVCPLMILFGLFMLVASIYELCRYLKKKKEPQKKTQGNKKKKKRKKQKKHK
jgi:flagellar basal body-associated protein FliL